MATKTLSAFNPRAKFGDWWEGTNTAQRAIFRVVLIGVFVDDLLVLEINQQSTKSKKG